MADETPIADSSAPVVAPVVAPVADPAPVVAVEPVQAPVVETPVVETPAETPITDAAPVETPVVDPAADPAKPETPVEAEAKPAVPVYAEFKFPEGVKVDPASIGAYTNILGKYGISQEAGQELVDFHANAVKTAQAAMEQRQLDVFAETRRGFVADFDKSAGNRRDTILNDAKWAISELVSDKKARAELWSVLSFTGAGDHKAVINAFAQAAKRLREPQAGVTARSAGPSQNQNPADRRYGAKN